ncbi:HAD family hydrolase [Hahella sp. SMD15-11]|uniref:Histidinol-phosphatase n=1 Tax=Thermohahella caldifontis TaxID=3142973 RepID=A0AB39USS8_9GAMM
MALAIFDLDNTLIAGDSDHSWGEYLADHGWVDRDTHRARNDAFYADYLRGELDIQAYLEFALSVLKGRTPEEMEGMRAQFVEERIRPILLSRAQALVDRHRDAGDTLLVITATNQFVTEPIVNLFGIESLIAPVPEIVEGRYTGRITGVPSYQEGKVIRLREWLKDHPHDLSEAWFYSDSHNDLPLLQQVGHPVAVDPDDRLRAEAEQRGWPVISLRD